MLMDCAFIVKIGLCPILCLLISREFASADELAEVREFCLKAKEWCWGAGEVLDYFSQGLIFYKL